jgi:hypothetical protein
MILATPALAGELAQLQICLMVIGWTTFAVYHLARRPLAVPRAVGALVRKSMQRWW